MIHTFSREFKERMVNVRMIQKDPLTDGLSGGTLRYMLINLLLAKDEMLI